jgi:hypothetical protein
MSNERINIKFGRTINTGNYESLRYDVALERDIMDKEDRTKVIEKETQYLIDIVDKLVGEFKDE